MCKRKGNMRALLLLACVLVVGGTVEEPRDRHNFVQYTNFDSICSMLRGTCTPASHCGQGNAVLAGRCNTWGKECCVDRRTVCKAWNKGFCTKDLSQCHKTGYVVTGFKCQTGVTCCVPRYATFSIPQPKFGWPSDF